MATKPLGDAGDVANHDEEVNNATGASNLHEQLVAARAHLLTQAEQLSTQAEQLSAQADELEQLRAQLQRLEGVPPQLATQD